ncbi:MAG TPA: hypothetical protein VMV10_27310 [Pirellulales bacterium]|nr:hypothetical protein [Pirellulales bacterium]
MFTTLNTMFVGAECSAKSIDYTPDLTSDEYWDAHSICLMRVTDVPPAANGKETITLDVIARLSSQSCQELKSVTASSLWFGVDEAPRPQPLRTGDTVVMIRTISRVEPIVVIKPAGAAEHTALIARIKRIAALRRGEGGASEIREAAVDDDETVSRYALKRLLAHKELAGEKESHYIERLRDAASDEGKPGTVRALCAQLMFYLQPSDGGSGEGDWLRRSIESATVADCVELRPLAWRALDLAEERLDNAAFFIRIATDKQARDEVRLAGFDAFDDERLFHPKHPDATSDAIFDACESLLRDRDARIRIAAAGCLAWICNRVGNPDEPRRSAEYVRKYVTASKAALVDALTAEEDRVARQYFATHLSTISRRIIPPR